MNGFQTHCPYNLYIIFACRDRLRTSINVWGDSIGAGVVEKLAKNTLHKLDAEEMDGDARDGEPIGRGNPSYAYYIEQATINTRI